ncbi:hypothetical protein CYLTODRAFT_433793 [Cylindrobasidium torrendii FP15055 ss-10]|uniref:Uncharacterized protein n=1 Tax=Cylindrobasidium torrendii FP15055 ss-10 TaxID=1314674 RepID=A0A0D7BUD6_9AGAR|nr:hypothetical protein CYLTODRAFT_433793 [Cylindrobasidium torrendii FP15055 ss-10]
MAPTNAQLELLWPLPGSPYAVDLPARWPGISPESTAAVRKYLRMDYERHHGFFNYRGAHNHTPFHLLVEYSLGGSPEHLEAIWDQHTALERYAFRAPSPVDVNTFANNLGNFDYYQGYLSFFSDRLLNGGSMGAVVEEWIFSPKANYGGTYSTPPEMLNRLLNGIMHPMLFLGYGLEFSLPGLVAEGLAQAAVHGSLSTTVLPRSLFDNPSFGPHGGGIHVFSIAARILRDRKFDGFKGSIADTSTQFGADLHRYASNWYVDGSDPKDVAKKIRDVVFLNTMIYSLGAWRDSTGTYYEADFTLMHLVTSALTLYSFVATLTNPQSKSLLLRGYLTRCLAFWIAGGRVQLPTRSFFRAPILTDFPGPKPRPSSSVYPDPSSSLAVIPNVWLQIVQSALAKTQRTLAHFSSMYGGISAGEFRDTELEGSEAIDGTLFVRTAALTMEWMGRIREGEPARFWGDDPNFPEATIAD